MKLKLSGLVVLALALLSVPSKADHTGTTGSLAKLQGETRELVDLVYNSWLNYNVKDSVYRFSRDVDQIVYCAQQYQFPIQYAGCPSSCRYYLDNANYSFRTVSNYLYDTYKDLPQVYYQWRETDNALRDVQVTPGPGPNPGPNPGPYPPPTPQTVKCIAVDYGWEEHYGGHVGYSYNLYSAQNAALNECRRYHSSCRIQSCE